LSTLRASEGEIVAIDQGSGLAVETTERRPVSGERVIFWCLPAVAVTWVVAFFLFPGFVPPMSPESSATEVARFYSENLSRVRYSMILFNWFGVALIPMLMLICERMRLMAHRTPILRYCMIGIAGAAPIDLLTSTIFWLIAAFRPDRSPELILLCNDLAWITYICGVPFLIGMCLFLAIGIFYDDQPQPVFARWVAWFNVVVAIALAPAAFAAFTLTGPFAWDGFVSFWVRNFAITSWIVVMAVMLRQAMTRDRPAIGVAA
jgi:hypothetical protein